MKQSIIAFAIILTLTVATAKIYAQTAPPPDAPPHHGGGMGMWAPMIMNSLTTELNLTQDQQDKLTALMSKYGMSGAKAGAGPRDPLKMLLANVHNVTPEQQERLKAILDAAKDWGKQHMPQHQEEFKGLVEQFKSDKIDGAKLEEIQRAAEKDRDNARVFIRQTIIQVHDVLTPDQRVEVAEKVGGMVNRFMQGAMPPPPMEKHAPSTPDEVR